MSPLRTNRRQNFECKKFRVSGTKRTTLRSYQLRPNGRPAASKTHQRHLHLTHCQSAMGLSINSIDILLAEIRRGSFVSRSTQKLRTISSLRFVKNFHEYCLLIDWEVRTARQETDELVSCVRKSCPSIDIRVLFRTVERLC